MGRKIVMISAKFGVLGNQSDNLGKIKPNQSLLSKRPD